MKNSYEKGLAIRSAARGKRFVHCYLARSLEARQPRNLHSSQPCAARSRLPQQVAAGVSRGRRIGGLFHGAGAVADAGADAGGGAATATTAATVSHHAAADSDDDRDDDYAADD